MARAKRLTVFCTTVPRRVSPACRRGHVPAPCPRAYVASPSPRDLGFLATE